MKKFVEYKEEKVFEGLLSDIATVVKNKVTYYFDKAKKILIQAISPMNIDGYNKGGIRVSTRGEGMPLLKEIPNTFGVEKTTPAEKRNIKELINTFANSNVDITEKAVDGFGELSDMGVFQWKDRRNGSIATNVIQDVETDFLKEFVLSNVIKVSMTSKKHSLPIMLFGAPGVGKTTIVNTVIKAYNQAYPNGKKGLIHIDCANLALDSLSLVMPTKDKVSDKIAAEAGVELSDVEKAVLSKEAVTDMTKEWLPCYKPTGDSALDAKADAIANGLVSTDGITIEGGIILLDELLRVQDPNVFGQLMNLINDRKLGDRIIGSKWTFICVSNRPNDDRTVANALKNAPTAFFNRFAGIYNIEPNLKDWLAWARGGDAQASFDFVTKGESKSGERPWHVDPRFTDLIEKNPSLISNIEKNDITAGELAAATNRSWEYLSNYLWDAADANNLKDWVLFKLSDLKSVIFGIIGKEYGQIVYDSVSDWRSVYDKNNTNAKKNKAERDQTSISDDERQSLDLMRAMETSKTEEEFIANAKKLYSAFKRMGEQATNAIMSTKVAEWGDTKNNKIRHIINILIKAYPDLKGRYAQYLEK